MKRSLIVCGLIALMMGCAPKEDNHDHGTGHEHDHSGIIRTDEAE